MNRSIPCIALIFIGASATAAPPTFRPAACPVTLDGTRLGTALTAGNSSLRNTFAYESSTGLYHWWGFVADDANFPSSASALSAVRHATSVDGIQFVSDSNLHYGIGSVDPATYGATIDPPLDFFRAAFDSDTETWKLLNWTENDQVASPSFGQYNYNISVNDLGSTASNVSVVHQGPLSSPFAGNNVGPFGLVDGKLYLRVDSLYGDGSGGGNGQFDYTDGIPAATSALIDEANLYTGTPYCWLLASTCGNSDPRIPAYVHNVGRTLRQTDGTLGTYYTFRHADGSRMDKQVWYVESADDGASWSAPQGVFADGNSVTIADQPLAADPNGRFSNVDVIQAHNVCRVYFSTQTSDDNFVMATATTGSACDALFADGFDGCE